MVEISVTFPVLAIPIADIANQPAWHVTGSAILAYPRHARGMIARPPERKKDNIHQPFIHGCFLYAG